MKLVLKWLARCTGLALAAAMAQGTMPTGAHAQAYPSQDIRLICAFPARQRRRRAGALLRRKAAADRRTAR